MVERSSVSNTNRVTPLQLLKQPIGTERQVTFAKEHEQSRLNEDLTRAFVELRDNSPKPMID
jgi:hypothetical protein